MKWLIGLVDRPRVAVVVATLALALASSGCAVLDRAADAACRAVVSDPSWCGLS